MSLHIIERYLHDLRNARVALAEAHNAESHGLAQVIIRDILIYLADHIDDVESTRQQRSFRRDSESRAMLADLDELLRSYAAAGNTAKAVLDKARRQ